MENSLNDVKSLDDVKSLNDVAIVLNPGSKYWCQLLESIAKNEGWMYNSEDYWTMTNTIENFWMFLAIDRQADEAIGSVCLVYEPSISEAEDEGVYSLGLYYVRPEWRGKGVGTALFEKVMAIGQHGNMGLLGALKMSPLYASKHGFDKMPSYHYMIVRIPTEHISVAEVDSEYIIKDLDNVDWKSVINYETKTSQRYRPKYFIKFIISGEFCIKVALSTGLEVVGICAIRVIRLSNYLMIQPFYADNEIVAKSLLSSTLAAFPNIRKFSRVESVYPGSNEKARRVFEAVGGEHAEFKSHSQLAFTKKLLPTGGERVYGVLDTTITFI